MRKPIIRFSSVPSATTRRKETLHEEAVLVEVLFSIRFWKRFKAFLKQLGFKYVSPEGDWKKTAVYDDGETRVEAEFRDIRAWGGRDVPRKVSVTVSGKENVRVSSVLDFLGNDLL